MASLDDPFDLVLASDCLYDPAMFSAFRRALVAFCSPRTVLLMTYKRRLDRCDKKKQTRRPNRPPARNECFLAMTPDVLFSRDARSRNEVEREHVRAVL